MKIKSKFFLICNLICAGFIFATENSAQIIELQTIIAEIKEPQIEQKQILTQEEIQQKNPSDVIELLEIMGIQIKGYGSYGSASAPSIRGFTGSTIKVVIDGICVNSAQNGTFDFSSLNVENISKIEVVRGSFIEEVNADGGAAVIYITTKKQTLGLNLLGEIYSKTYFCNPFDTVSVLLNSDGQISENTFFNLGTKGIFAKNEFIFLKDSVQLKRENNQVLDSNVNFAINHFWKNGRNFSFTENFYIGNKQIPGPAFNKTVHEQKDFNNNLNFSVSIPDIFNKIEFSGGFAWQSNNQKYDSLFSGPNQEHSKHNLNALAQTASAKIKITDYFFQSFGINLKQNFLQSTNIGNKFLLDGFVKSTTKILLFNNKSFSLSIPLSVAFSGKNISFVPKIGFSYSLSKSTYSINFYRIYLFPDLNQLYWQNSSTACGNPNLNSEDGLGAEFTSTFKFQKTNLSFSVFSNYYKNKIQWSTEGTGIWMPQNVASAFYLGCNLIGDGKFSDNLSWNLNVEYLYNALLKEGLTYKKRIMYTPEWVIGANLNYAKKAFNINLNSNFVSKRYISNLNAVYLNPYLLVNVNTEFYPAKWIVPYLKINNLLNVSYEQTEDYPSPGISLEIGIKFIKK